MLWQMAKILLFLWLNSIPIYHVLLILSFVGGHLGCFLILAIVNGAAVNIRVPVSFFFLFLFFFLFTATLVAYGSSQARDLIEAAAALLHTATAPLNP